ncbi:hypothetical protein N480_03435 [Pseudoalteromonas luteoviolacea S2607]|nr:hypothetical protein N480_03435 [Pseudoalteromonas luteoviolacea S2607]
MSNHSKHKLNNFVTMVIPFSTSVSMFDIQLNSFVRRVEKKDELKALIKSSGAKLNRKGRSRHWRLQGNWQQFEIIIQHAHIKEEPSWQWVIEKLNGYKPKPQMDELVSIVKRNPAITLQKLIAQTDCTLIEARKAFDIAAWE